MEYSEHIRQLRIQKNVTQQQLADEIGVSRQSVVRWENGFTVPSMYYAQKLAEYFGVTVTALMTGIDELPKIEKSERDTQVKYGSSTFKFCIVTFLIAVIYIVSSNIMSLLRYYYTQVGLSPIALNSIFKMVYSITDGIVFVSFAVALALWIARLVAWLSAADDKYMCYRIYRKWSIGLAVWLINMLTVALVIYVYIMSVFFLFVMAAVIAAPIYCLIDFAIKRSLGRRMVVARNKTLGIINSIYCAVVSCGVVALIVWIVYAVTTFRPTYGLEVAFAILYFCIAAVVIIISYAAVRVTLHFVSARRANREDVKNKIST